MGRFERARVGAVHLATPARLLSRRIRLCGAAATATRSQLGGEVHALGAYTYMRPAAARVLVLVAVIAAMAASALAGTPSRLPGVALSSAALFHLERTVAFVAGCVTLMVIVVRAWSGHLPVELSTQGFKYAESADVERLVDRLIAETDIARADRAELRLRVEALETEA